MRYGLVEKWMGDGEGSVLVQHNVMSGLLQWVRIAQSYRLNEFILIILLKLL